MIEENGNSSQCIWQFCKYTESLAQIILTVMPSIQDIALNPGTYSFMAHFLKHSDSTTKSIVTRSHAYLRNDINKPFPSYPKRLFQSEAKSRTIASSKHSHFQNEATLKTFLVKMNFTSMRIKTHFQIHGIALSLTLKWKRLAAQKLACVAGGILVSGVLSWRRSRHAKRVERPRGNFKLT